MLRDLFDADEMRALTDRIAVASDAELEAMRGHLSEVIGLINGEWMSRINGSGGKPQVVERKAPVEVKVVSTAKPVSRGGTVKRTCDNRGCGVVYEARQADLRRGWGRCCSKSCAASHKLRGNPDHGYLHRGRGSLDDDFDPSWDSHKS